MESVIQFKNVTKKYRGKVALNDVSYSVPKGVVFALLGDNGAGKTTSIKTMLGFVKPDKGHVSVLGLDSQKNDVEIRSRIGYVAEQPSFYDWMRVDEVGWFVAGVRGGQFFDEYRRQIEQFKIPMTNKISELSKGMKAKVALAVATSHDPEILILDEPTSGLDPMVRREFMESMVDRAATGKTVFLSSHQLNEVERVADYVALMKDGNLLFTESLNELKENISEISIAVSEAGVPLPKLPGEIIHSEKRGRQWRVLAKGVGDDAISQIESQEFVEHCSVKRPTLEEIFVGYLSENESGFQNKVREFDARENSEAVNSTEETLPSS